MYILTKNIEGFPFPCSITRVYYLMFSFFLWRWIQEVLWRTHWNICNHFSQRISPYLLVTLQNTRAERTIYYPNYKSQSSESPNFLTKKKSLKKRRKSLYGATVQIWTYDKVTVQESKNKAMHSSRPKQMLSRKSGGQEEKAARSKY